MTLARKNRPAKGDKRYTHSRLTNGRGDLLPSIDGRSTWARLARDVIGAMTAHLGGDDNVTEPQRMIVRTRCRASSKFQSDQNLTLGYGKQ